MWYVLTKPRVFQCVECGCTESEPSAYPASVQDLNEGFARPLPALCESCFAWDEKIRRVERLTNARITRALTRKKIDTPTL